MDRTTRDEREAQARELLRALRTRTRSASYRWNGKLSVEAGLLLEGARFEFVQAMRLLTRIARRNPQATIELVEQDASSSSRVPTMDDAEARFSLRLRSRIGFDFSPASVHTIRLSSEVRGEIEVVANLLALAGQNAPLPAPYAETVLERQSNRDMALTDFLDIFHHRLLELYYLTSLHTAPWLAFRHPAANETAQQLFALVGLGQRDLRDKSIVPDRVWLKYAGLLWHRPRSASAFRQILADHFKLPIALGGAVGRWLPIEKEDQARLGTATARIGSTTLGKRVWIGDSGLLVRVGPVPAHRVASFLPGGHAYREMQAMAQFYFEDRVTLDLELISDAQEAAPAKLGNTHLGWTSWLRPQGEQGPLRLRVRYTPSHG